MKIKSILCFLLILLAIAPAASQTLTGSKIANGNTLLAEVKQQKGTVLICKSKNAYAYHTRRCSGLSNCSKTVVAVTAAKAKELGYRPCKRCH